MLHAHGLEGGLNALLPPGPLGLLQVSWGYSRKRQRRRLAVGLREGAIQCFGFQLQAVVGCCCAIESANRLAQADQGPHRIEQESLGLRHWRGALSQPAAT